MTDPVAKGVFLAMMAEKLQLSKLFRYNSAMKHGVPQAALNDISITVSEQPESVKTSDTSNLSDITKIIDKSKSQIPGWVWAALAALLTALGIWSASSLWPDKQNTTTTQPTELLIPWLDDIGANVP